MAIVKSAYRRRERIEFTTLDRMAEADIGMLSTVLIGNSNTVLRDGLMVTPRGYANKYEVEAGKSGLREGERSGRSLSTGLNGWLESLHAEVAAGTPIEALAARHRLPVDYIAATLAEPLLDEAEQKAARKARRQAERRADEDTDR